MDLSICPVTLSDIPALLRLIRQLAQFEKLDHEVTATEERLRESLFREPITTEAIIARLSEEPVGYALYFQNFSTFLARPGLYLEDLFVVPTHRGRGIGRKLLAYVAHLAVSRDCGRLEWAVLDWNTRAIRFYERLGAKTMSEWTVYRMAGAALRKLAEE
ncbi:MAG: GNAT family N-acetyltransferase [Deltaproteobacteria bacterium]|nr:GNAT family N-acetyltransferase [Deltaproteobacteria bacterium]